MAEDMRDEEALEPADLCDRNMTVVDVGGGTGFTTLGISMWMLKINVTILDQCPHQLAKAKQKEALKECKIIEGDAEDLPFPTDYADRYVSAGSIEYWPDQQRGIKEEYRVLKIGGKACIIGPVYPTFWLSQFFADMWMLFPKEEEYIQWFKNAGFKDIELKKIGPKWYRGVRRHGLIMGCSVTGYQFGPKVEHVEKLSAHHWRNCIHLLCASSNLHVDQGPNSSTGHAYIKDWSIKLDLYISKITVADVPVAKFDMYVHNK